MSKAGFLFVTAIPLCAISAAIGLASWLNPPGGLAHKAGSLLGHLCAILATISWALRWAEAGHVPIFGTYESGLSLAAAILLAAQAWDFRRGEGPALAPWSCLLSGVILAHALSYDATPYALTISERSWVVDVHAVLAWAAFGSLALNAGLSAAILAGRSHGGGKAEGGMAATLKLGFLLHSGMMASGSLYKFLLFGRAWSFDPIETMGFAAWISYGTLLHLYLMGGWRGRKLAGWSLLVFFLLLVSYRAIVYFPSWSTYHIFDMDIREHVRGG